MRPHLKYKINFKGGHFDFWSLSEKLEKADKPLNVPLKVVPIEVFDVEKPLFGIVSFLFKFVKNLSTTIYSRSCQANKFLSLEYFCFLN